MSRTSTAMRSTDWDFTNAPPTSGVHAIHPYPARFIPQIPQRLIELFHPGDSSVVLDPFCGCGTTLSAAVDMGLDAWGIDVNPLACLISRVKTTPLPPGFERAANRVLAAARDQMSTSTVCVPLIPRVDHWFKREVQQALACLVDQIARVEQPAMREALQVALSSIIVRVSNQESDTRYAAVEKNVSAEDVFLQFERATANVSHALASVSDNLFRRLGRAHVLNRDTLTVRPCELPRPVGLVVTSPPYPNAYEYWLYHKYRMYWLGMDPIAVRRREIGARPHYFKSKHQDEHDFERQMGVCFGLLAQVMAPDAKACFLVGRSVIHGRTIDNVALLERAATPHGFAADDVVERAIPRTRKAFNPAHGSITQEHLVVFTLRTPP